MQDRWRGMLISPEASIKDAMKRINDNGIGLVLVTDASMRLLGIATDGDIRRGLLNGVDLGAPVSGLMNPKPFFIETGKDAGDIQAIMRKTERSHIPIVDGEGRIVGIESLNDIFWNTRRDNPVVIMAGGLGTRLRPLTNAYPKPMLEVGGKPILESILEGLRSQGFGRFLFAVNFMAEIIETHFGDGGKWGVEIGYLREREPLGTAGALGLLPGKLELPVLVVNGDVIVKADFGALVDQLKRHQADAVMGVREYATQIPYGVVRADGDCFVDIVEKPVKTYFINAGLYALSPEAVAMTPKGERIDMPSLFAAVRQAGRKAVVYPVTDFWLDIGRHEDLHFARNEFSEGMP